MRVKPTQHNPPHHHHHHLPCPPTRSNKFAIGGQPVPYDDEPYCWIRRRPEVRQLPQQSNSRENATNASSCYRHNQMLREAIWLAARRNRGREVNGELGLEIDFQDADTENDRNLVPLSQFRRRMRIAHTFSSHPQVAVSKLLSGTP